MILRTCLTACLALVTGTLAAADEHPLPEQERAEMRQGWETAVKNLTERIGESPKDVDLYSRRADAAFFLGRFADAVADYEKMVELDPGLENSHWRRGIAYFYAQRPSAAAHQFEIYHSFDDVDRENGIWRYLSQRRAAGLEKARAGLLKYKKDDREPFPAVYQLFAGKIEPQAILDGIEKAEIRDADRQARRFYAQLYIGLNYAVEREPEKALAHLREAVANDWGRTAGFGPHYMWQVGRLHYEHLLRERRPPLPEADATVTLPAQEWPLQPGPRTINVYLHFPGGRREHVKPTTGLMLSLHNWGGTRCVGAPDPQTLVKEFDVVAICVDYLQSGAEPLKLPEPYDFGYLQALDALRGLHFVYDGLARAGVEFDHGRLYATGGSGGGNVTLMVNKLAPRTFACGVDLCGMAKLSDDIAFNLPGGSDLDAKYSRDPQHPFYLSPDHQALRFIGLPAHLETMKQLGNTARIIVVHGGEDVTCPTADKRELVENFEKAELPIDARFLTKEDLDGKVFTSTGHALGNRTEIVKQTAGKYLRPDSPDLLRRTTPNDFDLADEAVQYTTPGGRFIISYVEGYPVGRFEQKK